MSKQIRLQRLEQLKSSLGLDAILLTSPANLYYFSGFRTTLYTRFNGVLVADPGKPVLITSYVDEQLAKKEVWGPVWVRDIRIHGPISRPDVFQDYRDALKPVLSRVRRLGVDAISLSLYRELQEAFPGVDIEDVSTAAMDLRTTKDPEEIECVRKASEIAIRCMAKGREVLARRGATEADLGAEVEMEARRLGADGYGYPILISSGEKITAPHAPPLPVVIREDTPFVRIAFSPTYNGYCSSIIRTFCRKPPDGLSRRYVDAFFDTMGKLQRILVPGTTVQDILKTVADSYEAHGVRNAWGGDMGYSLGITVHEPPRIGGTDNTALQANMCLAVMPGLRTPGEATFHHSDIYAVSESGGVLLSPGYQEIITYG